MSGQEEGRYNDDDDNDELSAKDASLMNKLMSMIEGDYSDDVDNGSQEGSSVISENSYADLSGKRDVEMTIDTLFSRNNLSTNNKDLAYAKVSNSDIDD